MGRKSTISLRLVGVFIVLMMAVTVGSFLVMRIFLGRVSTSVQSERGQSGSYSRHFAFIYDGSDTELWDMIYEGAKTAGDESDAYVEYFGRNLTQDYTSAELMDMAIDANVDGIIVAGDAAEEFTATINRATENNIPVVTVFSDCPDSERISFVGFSSYTMGRQYGSEIVKFYDGRDMIIKVVIGANSSGSSHDLVISGIADEFADRGLGDACRIEGIYVSDETAFTAEEDIRDLFVGSALPDAIVALNAVYTRCLFQATVDYNKVGAVYLYGFDDSDDILEALGKDLLTSVVTVDATQMGSSAVNALTEYLDTGYVSNYIAQDTVVIRPSDLAEEDDEGEDTDLSVRDPAADTGGYEDE